MSAVYHHFVTVATPDGPMPMYICTPEGNEKRPAVLVIQGMHGANSFEMSVAERFAEQGYVAALPDLFHRGPSCFSPQELNTRRRALTDPQRTSDLNAAISYLDSQSYVDAGRQMGILGFCMGGRVSYYMAATNPRIGVAAVFYGGGIPNAEGDRSPLDLTPNIGCPILIFDGELDHNPTPDIVANTVAELRKHGKVHELNMFPDVGHGYMSRTGEGAKQERIDYSWKRLFEWWDRYLPVKELAAAGR